MTPSDHPAYLAFMEIWDEPIDVSNGSRQGMDDHEQGVVYAAQTFVAADPPAEVRDALIAWLLPQETPDRAWDYAGQALRIICDR